MFPLITFPYSSRILQPDGIGKVNFAQSVVSYFAIFAALGIGSYGIREAAKLRDDKTKLNKLTAGVRRISSLTAGTSGSIRTSVSESSLPIATLGNVEFYAVSGERVWIDYTLSSNGTYMTIEWSSNIAITADTYYCVWIEGLV